MISIHNHAAFTLCLLLTATADDLESTEAIEVCIPADSPAEGTIIIPYHRTVDDELQEATPDETFSLLLTPLIIAPTNGLATVTILDNDDGNFTCMHVYFIMVQNGHYLMLHVSAYYSNS